MTTYDWPPGLPRQAIGFDPRGMTVSGAPSIGGRRQTASTGSGFWTARVASIVASTPARVKLYRALRAQLEGGAHTIRLPACDGAQAPWPLDGNGNPITSMAAVTFDDGATFDDGSSFYEPVIKVTAAAAAAAGTTLLDVTVANAGDILAGNLFSIGDRLHVIREIVADDGAGAMSFFIWPELRTDVASGGELDFDNPVCLMTLASEAEGDLALQYGRFGFPDMAFVEAI